MTKYKDQPKLINFITDTNNLSLTSNVLANKKIFRILKDNQLITEITCKSMNKIIRLSSAISEQVILFAFTKNNITSEEEEDSFNVNMMEKDSDTPEKRLLDTDDINIEEHLTLDHNGNEVSSLKEFSEYKNYNLSYDSKVSKVSSSLPVNTIFKKYFRLWIILWTLLSLFLLLASIMIIIHLTSFYNYMKSLNHFYFFYNGVLSFALFLVSLYQLALLVHRKPQKICANSFSKRLLYFTFLVCFGEWAVREKVNNEYLFNNCYFNSIFIFCVGVIMCAFVVECVLTDTLRQKEIYTLRTKGIAEGNFYRDKECSSYLEQSYVKCLS